MTRKITSLDREHRKVGGLNATSTSLHHTPPHHLGKGRQTGGISASEETSQAMVSECPTDSRSKPAWLGLSRMSAIRTSNRIEATDAPSGHHFAVAGASAAARICDPCQLRKAAQRMRKGDTGDTARKEAAMQRPAANPLRTLSASASPQGPESAGA